jgi:predicted metallopeptidase
MIKYQHADDIREKIQELVQKLDFNHIDLEKLVCVRSEGSSSRYTIARCHALSRIWQKALKTKAHYIIEVISERFDQLDEEERVKTLIHELLHIPNSFGGGFRHHRPYVNKRNVEKMYEKYKLTQI